MFENWNPKPKLTSIRLDPLVVLLKPGETGRTTIITEPSTADISGEVVTWESEDETIATVDSEGVITAIGLGATKINVSVLGFSYYCLALVKEGMHLNEETITIPSGQIKQLTIEGEDFENQDAVWSSLNEDVVKVDDNGLVIGICEGKGTILVSTEEKFATCEVTVSGKLGDVDNDLDITSYDAYMALAVSVDYEIDTENEEQIILKSDADKDGTATAHDAYKILQYSVGIIDEF